MDIGAIFHSVIVAPMLWALQSLNDGCVALGLNFGVLSSWALTIILFTLLIKIVTLPLTLQSLRSSKATARLQPQLKLLQKQYGKDREKMLAAQQQLYKENGVNPLAGCLPTLIQMPIWIGLYQALLFLANSPDPQNSVLASSHFFWISNLGITELAGLTGIANAGIDVIFRWPPVIPILALLTGVTGWVSQKMMMQMQSTDPSQQQMQTMFQFMPIMFIFFSLSVPSGLVLYWVANNVFTMLQQWVLVRWGGINNHPPIVIPNFSESANGRAAAPKTRAPAAALRGGDASASTDASARADGAQIEPVRTGLPQAAPGARKRRRRSR